MSAIPYALSVHHFISSVGADAGFAAIIGLALVVLLFFVHARETSTLRSRAEAAEEALNRLELYVDQLARSGPSSAPRATPAPAAATAPGAVRRLGAPAPGLVTPAPVSAGVPSAMPAAMPAVASSSVPVAPAGVGAPALSAATRLIPAGDEPGMAIHAERGSASTPGVAAAVPAAAPAAAAVMDPPAPRPSTAAGGANGATTRVPPPDLNRAPAPTRGPAPRPGGGRAGGGPASSSNGSRRDYRGGSRVSRGVLAVASVLALAVVVVVVLVVLGSGGGSTKTASAGGSRTTSTTASRRGRGTRSAPVTVTPSAVTVAVLNGTSTNLLAADVYNKLSPVGYKKGKITNAASQTQATTVVGYLPGYRADGVAVAKQLKLPVSSVQPVSAGNRGIACNGSSPTCATQVVVTVGSDLSSAA